jgi:hypothetical protein
VAGEDSPPEAITQQNIPKKKNTYPTLFSALAHSQTSSVIKIETGLFNENNDVKTADLRIQAS